MFDRILVPLDGSALAESALPFAQALAQSFDAPVLLLRVWTPASYVIEGFPSGKSMIEFDQVARINAQDYLKENSIELQKQGVRVESEMWTGPIADGILDAAEERAASIIVMSTHGRSGVGRWVLGSIAERVLSASRVPVLLIR